MQKSNLTTINRERKRERNKKKINYEKMISSIHNTSCLITIALKKNKKRIERKIEIKIKERPID